MAALGCALDLRYLGSGAALGTQDLRYLCSGAALGNLVQGLAVPRQRALAGWLPRNKMFGGMAFARHHIIINDPTHSILQTTSWPYGAIQS